MLDEENEMFYFDGRSISLGALETALLGYLIQHKNRIVPYKEIAESIYEQYTNKTKNNTVVLAQRINKKIGCRLIRAKRHFGYKIVWRNENELKKSNRVRKRA